MIYLEENFDDEQTVIETFAMGNAKDCVALNVSGTVVATTRSTLCTIEDSVLAKQFNDTKWTEQGSNGTRTKEWSPDEVKTWAKSIDGLPDDVSIILHENKITGLELLALGLGGLKMIGIGRAGTVCLLLKEIEKPKKESRIIVTLIEHSSYCFGKILNYLLLKRLHSLGLLAIEPTLPLVQESLKRRFEKVVCYYFPGDVEKFVLGMNCEVTGYSSMAMLWVEGVSLTMLLFRLLGHLVVSTYSLNLYFNYISLMEQLFTPNHPPPYTQRLPILASTLIRLSSR